MDSFCLLCDTIYDTSFPTAHAGCSEHFQGTRGLTVTTPNWTTTVLVVLIVDPYIQIIHNLCHRRMMPYI